MKPMVKIIAAAVGLLVTLIIIAAISLTTLVDPNDYKEEITAAVQDATGRQLTFKGDMSITLFPWLGVSLGEVFLNNPKGFTEPVFASVQKAEVSIKVLPLLYQQVEISDVVLNGLTLNLIENKQGNNNWTFVPQEKANAKPKRRGSIVDSSASKKNKNDTAALAALLIESLSISDTNISYENQRDGKKYTVADFSLQSSALRAGEKFKLKLKGNLTSFSPAITSPFLLTIEALPSADFTSVDVTDITATLEPKGEVIPGGQTSVHFTSSLLADIFNKVVTIRSSELTTYETKLSAEGEVKYAEDFSVNGHASIDTDYRKIAKALGISPPQPANDNSSVSISTGIKLDPTSVTLNDIQGNFNGYPLNGDFSYYFGNTPQLKLKLIAEQIDLDPYIALAKLVSEQKGSASGAKKAKKASAKVKGKTSLQKQPLAQETLSKLNANAEIEIKRLTANKIVVSDITIVGSGTNGIINLKPVRLHVFGGKVDGSIKTDLRGSLPISSITVTTQDMNLSNIAKLFTGTDYVTGDLLLKASLSAYGTSWDSISRTLNGKANFNATKGTITALNILPVGALDLFQGKDRQKIESSLTAQPYKVIRGSLFAKNGRVSNNDFLIDAAEMKVKGAGFTNLPTDSVHYRADVAIDNIPELPILISGKLSNPSYAVDMQRFLGKSLKGITDTLLNGDDKDGKKGNPLKQLERRLKNLFK